MAAYPEMYAPVLAFAHLFALFWLIRMLLIMYKPALGRGCKKPGAATGKVTTVTKDPTRTFTDDTSAGRDQASPPPTITAAGAKAAPPPLASTLSRLATVAAAAIPGGGAATGAIGAACPPDDEDSMEASSSEVTTSPLDSDMGARPEMQGVIPSKDSQLILRRLTTNLKPMVLEWVDLGCSYETSQGPKTVLQHVYGQAAPGQMLALMGPSGAGKSTLMDIISGRKSVGNLTGHVLVNGAPRGPDFTRKTAYVPQYDNFLPTMTVKETAYYYASLLMPRSWGPAQRRERISQVLAAMGLSHTADTLVGGTLPGGIMLRGLSGGERKRLSIATGIISTPAVIFLDEPTSGLDSFAALSVMGYMQVMAHRGGHSIISSIHQPRAAIWAMFDTALVLSSGLLMYFGPREELVPWFVSLGYHYDAAMHGVPSDWAMDLVNVGFHKPQKFYGRMINTKDELKEASDAFIKQFLTNQQGALVEEGRGGSANGSGGGGYKAVTPRAQGGDASSAQHDSSAPQDGGLPAVSRGAGTGNPVTSLAPGVQGVPSGSLAPSLSRRVTWVSDTPGVWVSPVTGDVESVQPVCHGMSSATSGGGTAPGVPPVLPPPGNTVGTHAPAQPAAASAFTTPFANPGVAHNVLLSATPPVYNSTSAAGAGGAALPSAYGDAAAPTGSRAAPMPPEKVAELQAVLDQHAQAMGYGSAAQRRSPLRRAADALLCCMTCGAVGSCGVPRAGEGLEAGREEGGGEGRRGGRGRSGAGWARQFRILLWRELLSVTRNPADVAGRMLIFTWISLLVGLIYYNLDDSIGAIRSRLNVLFVQPTIFLLLPYVYMSLYSADKQYFIADASSKLYAPSAYYAAKQLAILPFAVLNVLAFSYTLYGMAGLRMGAVPIVANGAISVLLYLTAAQVLALSAIITPNQDIAFMVAIAWTAVNLLMSNFMVRFSDMSQVWLSELRYVSAMGFAFEGYTTAEFRGAAYSCAGGLSADVVAYLPTFLPNTPSLNTPYVLNALSNPGADCVVNLGSVLDYFGIFKPIWLTVVILIGYLFVMHVLTYLSYLLLGRKERR